MSTQTTQAVILICDECGAELGTDGRFRSAMDARCGAYAEGWRFPPVLTKTGAESRQTHDACPDCAPTWVPRGSLGYRPQYRKVSEVKP